MSQMYETPHTCIYAIACKSLCAAKCKQVEPRLIVVTIYIVPSDHGGVLFLFTSN